MGLSPRARLTPLRKEIPLLKSASSPLLRHGYCSVFALAALCLLASCSRRPLAGPARAPAASPDQTQAQAAAQEAEPTTLAVDRVSVAQPGPGSSSGLSDEGAARSAVPAEAEAEGRSLEIPPSLDPEELAASEDEVALLDELLELTLPEPPRVLSHKEALLHTRSELPLVINTDVQRLLNYFTETKRGTATIRTSLGRGTAFRLMIERIFEEEEVPRELYYLAMAESGFKPKARSHARATGMWQFMSSRGKQYGLRQDRYVDLRYDAETATRAAAKHLKDLHIEFGDWYLAMAAYNSGPNRVKSAIRRTGSRDYWTLVQRRALPRETRNYVPIILAMALVGHNLDLFELEEIDYAPPQEYDTIRTQTETSFALIADATGSSVDAIKELNQALLRSATPPYAYDLRIPKRSRTSFEREIALVPADKRLHWRRYEVRQGETLAALANRYKVKPETLLALNSLPLEGPLQGGQRLTVPTTTKLATTYRYFGGGRAGGLLEPGTGRYRIASGDTLGGIARRFGTSVANLQNWNGLDSTRIRAGRYLIVDPNAASGTAAVASGSSPTGRYTVRRGDSLSKIGARVGASVAQLRAWNGIRGSTIHPGQELIVGQTSGGSSSASAAPSSAAGGSGTYRVVRGDSLDKIARRHGTTVAQLRAWNRLSGSRIHPGQELVVGLQAGAGQTTSYRIKSGDTLGLIAQRFNVSVNELMRWNGLRSSRIQQGSVLVIRPKGS